MSLEKRFKMRNLTSFRMEKLCYDLKLEVLEEMDAKDTIELVKVNAKFQPMLSRNPWLVFGDHVYGIYLGQSEFLLWKLPGLVPYEFGAAHLPLSKRIHSCDGLLIDWRDEEFSDEFVTILNQLKSVKRLVIYWQSRACLPKFFENFHSMVEECVRLSPYFDGEDDQVISFIANQANDCQEFLVDLSCCTTFNTLHYYYDAFAKTTVKFLDTIAQEEDLEGIVQSIVKNQIPSKNLKAAFYVDVQFQYQEVNARIVDFLSHFRGMKRLDGESLQEVIKIANELVEKHITKPKRKEAIDFMDCPFFQRNIDSSRDCVYVLQSDEIRSTKFLAFNIQRK